MGQAGFLEHEDSVKGIRMFAREVYPRLKEAFPKTTVSGQFGDVAPKPPEEWVLKSVGSGVDLTAAGPLATALGAGR
jgi:hypothetical protein